MGGDISAPTRMKRITETIELSKGDQFTATGTTEILDTDGDLILTGCNTLTGTRLE